MSRLEWLRRPAVESGGALETLRKVLRGRDLRSRRSSQPSLVESLETRTLLTTYVVDTTTDDADDAAGTPDGLISLREAVIAANTNLPYGDAPAGMAEGDTIVFDQSVFTGMPAARTIDLDNGALIIIDDLRILGVADETGGVNGVVLNADGAGGADRAFRIITDELVSLADLTVTNAVSPDGAGGGALRIIGGGRTILTRVTIENSTAVGRGGGILLVASTLETHDSIIRNNDADTGGGIANILGNITLNHTLVTGNYATGEGGGISNDGGRLILRGSVVSANTADAPIGLRGGGGIHNISAGRLAISNNSEVIGNTATFARGGGIYSFDGGVTIDDSTVSTNHAGASGGGIEIVHGEAIILSSLIGGPGADAGNSAGDPGAGLQGDGGGLHLSGTARVEVEDSLVQYNEATGNGGGFWNSPQGTLIVRGGSRPVITSISEGIANTAFGLFPIVNQFRTSLGADNGGVPGSQGSGRREIDWDDVPDVLATPDFLPENFYNLGFDPLARGIELSTPGTGFQVSATNASTVGTRFSNINPNYNQSFSTFSAERLFTPIGSNVTVVDFFIPGTNTPAIVQGFGAVFTDVDLAGETTIEFFDPNGKLLVSRAVTAMDAEGALSFLGVTYSFPAIAQVRITTGDGTLGLKDVSGNGPTDVVVMDDFIFGEPVTLESIATETLIRNNIAHGDEAADGGGGIYNDRGRVAVVDATIQDNLADGLSGSGGGILSRGGLTTLDDSIVSGNDSVRAGGGIEVVSGQTLLTNVTLGGLMPVDGNSTGLLPFDGINPVNPGNPGNGGGLNVSGTATVRLTGGSVQNNRAANEGGGLWNAQTGVMIVEEGSLIANNEALGDEAHDGGGGIFNQQGRLIVSDATVVDNSAPGADAAGGGLYSLGGSVTLSDVLFESNSANRAGGGIAVSSSLLFMTNVTVLGNSAGGVGSPGVGGGLHSAGTSRVDVFGGLVEGNIASSEGGGLWNSVAGLMILHGGTAIRGNTAVGAANHDGGGGIFNDGGRLAIAGAEISGNMAAGPDSTGGGLLNRLGVVTIENSTLSGNMSDSGGGGIANYGTLLSTNNTIVLNIGDPAGTKINAGGVYTPLGAWTELRNTIVAGNQSATQTRGRPQSSDLGGDGDWGASRYNLIGNAFTAGTLEDGVNGNIVGNQGVGTIDLTSVIDPTLQDNGGPTQTHALTFSSLAINKGSNALALNSSGGPLLTDQRGPGFARIFNSTVDIGAFERGL